MRDEVILVLHDEESTVNWKELSLRKPIIELRNFPLLRAALRVSVEEHKRRISAIVIDRCLSAEDFLEFLAELPAGYRGDILQVDLDGSGFLSAMMRGDGRALYRLKPGDVRFYLDTQFVPAEVVFPGRVPFFQHSFV